MFAAIRRSIGNMSVINRSIDSCVKKFTTASFARHFLSRTLKVSVASLKRECVHTIAISGRMAGISPENAGVLKDREKEGQRDAQQ